MNSITREFIWGLVLFITGILITLRGVENFLLEDTLAYQIYTGLLIFFGVIFVIISLTVLSRNLDN